ncbi:MAG: hypothetical protein DDG60_03040 [Anaerolineae bacterium]|nr:MAG: hypothetical protein DDG60_03040 [Anaerolineae bacterium]
MIEQYLLAFITGLTTGGLSCLAVQGGLLASSLANQIERDLLQTPSAPPKKAKHPIRPKRPNAALPILLFLSAKLVAYTLLGLLLGWLGSFLAFDPITRAGLMIVIAIFMVGNGLRMLNVHPFFRNFVIEPPRFITRAIRKTAVRNETTAGPDTATPLFLGALTVFIPCGVTQAMMAAALGLGNPLSAALFMFAFTLGTSPVFFFIAYFATQVGATLEKHFMRFVAIVVLFLGLVTFDNALNLLGAPSVSGILTTQQANASTAEAADTLTLQAENNGYVPARLTARADSPITLTIITENTTSCARDFVIPALKYYVLLPVSGTETVQIPPQPAGTTMRFTCSMGMYTGLIEFK